MCIIGQTWKMNKKYLFLFKPHPNWEFCGGVVGVIAEKFEDIQNVHQIEKIGSSYIGGIEHDFHNYWYFLKDDSKKELLRNKRQKFQQDCWVLFEMIEITDPRTGMIFSEYNYA